MQTVVEFIYRGMYTGSFSDGFNTSYIDSPVFHARAFAEGVFFGLNELKCFALGRLLVELKQQLDRISLKEVIYEAYSPWGDGSHITELRAELLDFIVADLIHHQDWRWEWILSLIRNCPEFGSELFHLLVSRGLLEGLSK